MLLAMLKSKIHRARVTACELDYAGSVAIDADILDLSGILPYEQVDIYNINNGERLTTYAIAAPRGSGLFALNGAAARKAVVGDKIIVCAYAHVPAAEARNYQPTIVQMDEETASRAKSTTIVMAGPRPAIPGNGRVRVKSGCPRPRLAGVPSTDISPARLSIPYSFSTTLPFPSPSLLVNRLRPIRF